MSNSKKISEATPLVSGVASDMLPVERYGSAIANNMTLDVLRQYMQSNLNFNASGVTTFNGRSGVVSPQAADYSSYFSSTTHDHTGVYSLSGHNHTGTYEAANANIQTHISTLGNPHSTSKSDVGLSNVDNTSDLNKPISTAVSSALAGKSDTTHNHDASYSAINHTHTVYAPVASPNFTGVATVAGGTDYTTAKIRNITLSVDAPTGGSNGDIWIKYTP